MKHLLIFILLICGINIIFADLTMVTEDWEPYHYNSSNSPKGVVIDILDYILKDINSPQNISDVKIYPWTRAYTIAKHVEDSVIFSTTRSPEREEFFKWVGPIFESKVFLIGKKSDKIIINAPTELQNYKIAVVKDDIGEIYIKEFNIPDKMLILSPLSKNNIAILNKGRVDLIVTDWSSFVHESEELGIDSNLFEPVYTVKSIDLYFAFNINTSDETVNEFEDSFNKLKQSEDYTNILHKYSKYIFMP